ncbi:MAG: glycosyltransferase family 2 protein [Blastocatellia bacterium]|nr:glycosyltransferase family 2 protein [Blastocatellia bacterium]
MTLPPFQWPLIAQLVFVLAVLGVGFVYVGYPALIFLLSRIFRQPVRRAMIMPRVTMIIAARNEEESIAMKLENALHLDYPAEKFEIIVASDASTDRTDEIVRGFAPRGVILHRQEVRQGKTRTQHCAVSVSSGEILVFSDATTMYQSDVIHKIVRNFADPTVGCVGGQLIYVDGQASAVGKGCRSYWDYEKFLKHCESNLGSLIGVSGCLYAVRRSCQAKLASDMIDDFVIATEIHLQGLRTVYEPEAISMEDTNHRRQDEWRMRVRVIEQTMRVLHRYRQVLSLPKHGAFAFQLICHKLMRYLVPVLLAIALVANWFAMNGSALFKYIFAAHAGFYTLALIGWIGDRFKIRMGLVAIPYYFTILNLATVHAFLKFVRGQSYVVWEPVREARTQRTPNPESFSEAHTL